MQGGAETRTLLLSQAYEPLRLIAWQRAVTLLSLGKVEVLREHDHHIRAAMRAWRAPAVVRLLRGIRQGRRPIRFSRVNIFTRDGHRCQYCGARKPPGELTYDHVLPRHMGGRTDWLNIVTACGPCNLRKGGRTPEQAGMRLLSRPVQPRWLAVTALTVSMPRVPEVWQDFLGSAEALYS